MAEYTNATRLEITKEWLAASKKAVEGLSDAEKHLAPEGEYYSNVPEKECRWMRELLDRKEYGSLSALYKGRLSGLVDALVPEGRQEEFYYALDQLNQFQMTAGWYRRSLRSKSYQPFVRKSILLLWAYSRLKFYGAELSDVLSGRVAPEIYDHVRNREFNYDGILAAQLDKGETKTVEAVREILLGENNTVMLSYELIRGIVMSRHTELYELLGKFLLAARLQEGVRQAVCETMDAGRPEAFLYLFQVIEDNNLVRYSSVKRAVSTWIGIFDEKNVDRITDKLVRLMGQCLRDETFCLEQIQSNDSVAISCGLWAKGFYDAQDGVDEVIRLVRNGTKNQQMTASYFNNTLQETALQMQAAKEVILSHSDDLELAAAFMPGFMKNVQEKLQQLVTQEEERYYGVPDRKAVRPKKLEPSELFESKEEAERAYEALRSILAGIPKKELVLAPCIFPWHQVTLSRSDIAVRMCLLAWMLQREEYLDEAAKLIPVIGQGNNYGLYARLAAARVLLYRPENELRKQVLFELLHNPESYTVKTAKALADEMELTDNDYVVIEKQMKYKSGRKEMLEILMKQSPEKLCASAERLLSEKSEECRMAALDMALSLKAGHQKEFQRLLPALSGVSEPTGREKVLLKELLGEKSEAQEILSRPGYGLYQPERPWVLPETKAEERDAAKLFVYREEDCIRVMTRLDNLIEKNKEREYTTAYGREELLGNRLEKCRYDKQETMELWPFQELWTAFYEKEIGNPQLLMEVFLYQCCRAERSLYLEHLELYKKIFGTGLLKKAPFKKLPDNIHYSAQADTVVRILFREYVTDEMRIRWGLSGLENLLTVLNDNNAFYETKVRRWNGEMETEIRRTVTLPLLKLFPFWTDITGKSWGSGFALRFRLQQFYDRQKGEKTERGRLPDSYIKMYDFVKCVECGCWDKELFYKASLTWYSMGALLAPATTVEQRGILHSRQVRPGVLNNFFGDNVIQMKDGKYCFDEIRDSLPAMKLAHEIYEEVLPLVLKVELKRGEQETPFSPYISSIGIVQGIDVLIQILTALGKEPLERTYRYYGQNTGRRQVLSHLLGVSYPKPEETAADLERALKGTDITKKRLAELAMYATQWIPMVEEYLGIRGFKSGCYYFMAHTSEDMDEYITSAVAKYTPLTKEELRDGAFDVQWFFEAYENLGEENFRLLYDAAKYSSSGTAHARARKYADAALGKVTYEELTKEITAKRNKDLLMSIGLLPLPEAKEAREKEFLKRYRYIQQFKKESRQFGAQRRASEGRAAELALSNLSVNAGFTDVMRLILRMETLMTEDLDEKFRWTNLGEAEIRIFVDEEGKALLQCRKDEKLLKSVPAKYKKEKKVLQYQELVKQLKEQHSRTENMLEQAMEDQTVFEVGELWALCANPVICPILKPLAVILANEELRKADRRKSSREQEIQQSDKHPVIGFLTEGGLQNPDGSIFPVNPDDKVRITHPNDFYHAGCWQEFQKYLFDNRIRQPFKQIFRELYVKLSEELEKEESLMFASNQIQPQKTVGVLKERRWVADYEDGLQKIYYKENIVARIYAMADWFTPSDVEAPTLESVAFYDRKTMKPLTIKEIPEIVYSEVMRDVDLAVSVAHVGGVDPETSHSTVEMRRVIVQYNLELFGLSNVRLEKSHAMIRGKLGEYTVHLGSGIVHRMGGAMISLVPVHSQHRGRIFLPFVDEDPKTAEIMSKVLLFAEDWKIKEGGAMISLVPVHSQHRGRIFLPFVDEDPKTAEIMSKVLLFAEDWKIKDPGILQQIQ